eukprot:EG_transcript_26510
MALPPDLLVRVLRFLPPPLCPADYRRVSRAWDVATRAVRPLRFTAPPATPCGFALHYDVKSRHDATASSYCLRLHIHSFSDRGSAPTTSAHLAEAADSRIGSLAAAAVQWEERVKYFEPHHPLPCTSCATSAPYPSFAQFQVVHQGDGWLEQPRAARRLTPAQRVRLWRWLRCIQAKDHLFLSAAAELEDDEVRRHHLYLYHATLSVMEGGRTQHRAIGPDFAWGAFTSMVWSHAFSTPSV